MEAWKYCHKHAALDENKWLASCHLLSAHWRGGGMGPRARLAVVLYPCLNFEHQSYSS